MAWVLKQVIYTLSTISLALLLSTRKTVTFSRSLPMGITIKCDAVDGFGKIGQGRRQGRRQPGSGLRSSNANVTPATAPSDEPFRYPIRADHGYPLPVPIEVMERYVLAHSVDALRRDPHPARRRYALAFYQCPLQAGNRLHHFWNGLLWAILTNRTVLWKYWDEETCRTYGMQSLAHISSCRNANTVEDCDHILVRAPWMASYDEWKDVILQSSEGEREDPFLVPNHVTMGQVQTESRSQLPENYEQDYGIDIPDKYPQRVLVFPMCYFKFWQLRNLSLQETLLKTQWARDTAQQLFELGENFLYGMFHRYTFSFAPRIRDSVPSSLEQDTSRYYTIGLHSRHRFAGLDGCDVDREVSCLQEILDNRQDKSALVRVAMMSDRICTIERLTSWLQAANHSVVVVHHDEVSPDNKEEHGPFAGAGFFQDLAVVSTSRSAVIAMARSSSDLLRELVAFDQAMEHWEQHGYVSREVESCVLPYQPDPDALSAAPTDNDRPTRTAT